MRLKHIISHPVYNFTIVFLGILFVAINNPNTQFLAFASGLLMIFVGVWQLFKFYTKSDIDKLNERYDRNELTDEEYYSLRKQISSKLSN